MCLSGMEVGVCGFFRQEEVHVVQGNWLVVFWLYSPEWYKTVVLKRGYYYPLAYVKDFLWYIDR